MFFFPKSMEIKGFTMLETNVLTTEEMAVPMTTPMAMSTMLPRVINFLNPEKTPRSWKEEIW